MFRVERRIGDLWIDITSFKTREEAKEMVKACVKEDKHMIRIFGNVPGTGIGEYRIVKDDHMDINNN